jgi:hypothetical protein
MIFFIMLIKNIMPGPGPVTVTVPYGTTLPSTGNVKAAETVAALVEIGKKRKNRKSRKSRKNRKSRKGKSRKSRK